VALKEAAALVKKRAFQFLKEKAINALPAHAWRRESIFHFHPARVASLPEKHHSAGCGREGAAVWEKNALPSTRIWARDG